MGEYIDIGVQTSIYPYQLSFHLLFLAYLHYLEKKQKNDDDDSDSGSGGRNATY